MVSCTSKSGSELFDLSGKNILFVGGAGYLGLCASEALARHGAHVIIADKQIEVARTAADALSRRDLSVSPLALDMGEETSIREAVAEALRVHRHIDVAINAATYSKGKPMDGMSLDDWNLGLKVTLTGAFLFSREIAQHMIAKNGGSIIQFGSMYGKVSPDPKMYEPPMTVNPLDYGVGKAGVLQMVRYQAVAWAPKRVRVNAIVPGPFPNRANALNDEAFIARLSQKVPMGRVGKPGEIAGAVVYLASDASSFVTGQQIVIDGGWTAW